MLWTSYKKNIHNIKNNWSINMHNIFIFNQGLFTDFIFLQVQKLDQDNGDKDSDAGKRVTFSATL